MHNPDAFAAGRMETRGIGLLSLPARDKGFFGQGGTLRVKLMCSLKTVLPLILSSFSMND